MPLLDHFRPPVKSRGSWEGFYGGWPATIIQDLIKVLPDNYIAEPRVHLGSALEVENGTFGTDDLDEAQISHDGSGSVATANWAPHAPTLSLDVDPTEFHEYEVLFFDTNCTRQLVAAIELASPANMDRPKSQRAFVSKCAALLQQRICVSIVDLVTTNRSNLYVELLAAFEQADPGFAPPPSTYAVTCRPHDLGDRCRLETWAYPLTVGQNLPVLPIWLEHDFGISWNLESSYQETCKTLRRLAGSPGGQRCEGF